MTPNPADPRPRGVDVAFWLLVAGAVLLVVNGLMASTLNFDTARSVADAGLSDEKLRTYLNFQRGIGIFSIVIGAALGLLAGKTRKGDPRFRRATIAFAVAITVLIVGVAVVIKIVHLLALVAVLPIIFGAIALMRPPVIAWFNEQDPARG
jgi:hypothetical protein